jgi:hypothetical protein
VGNDSWGIVGGAFKASGAAVAVARRRPLWFQ